MTAGQAYSFGKPTDLYVVTDGDSYKIYPRLASARSLKTRNNNDRWKNGEWKIYKINVENAQEVK